ncbi:MAG: glycosyltransferase family 9 protein [Zetaproteobacteria bacterium]|nr:glycosyltransferase family 9 protein [Zetaproteobacteria bacterium]
MANLRHILVVRLSAIGDIAMLVPVLQTFTKTYPHVKITVLSRPFVKPFFENMPNVSFFAADVNGIHKGIRGIYKLYKTLKDFHFDAIADMHNVIRTKILRSYFRFYDLKMVKIDKGRKDKRALTRPENKVFKPLERTHQRYADVFEKLGYPIDLYTHKFPERAPVSEKVSAFLKRHDIDLKRHTLIGMAPFAHYNSKSYPLDLMKEVILTLAKQPNLKLLIFGGGRKELTLVKNMIEGIDNASNVIGRIPFKEELNLIAQLKLMVSMDSANSHLAAMLNVKTVTLWGATHPYAGFLPFRHPLSSCLIPDLVKYPKLPSSVYGNVVVKGYEDCMRSILPQTVVAKVLENLK